MIDGTRTELVVASFDDPIATALRAEQAAGRAARSGAVADGPAPAEPGTVFLVARDRSGPLGCAGVRWIGADAAQVGPVYVRPEHRGTDLARTLLTAAEDLARDRGCRVARVRVADPREAGPYEENGYVRVPPPAPGPCESNGYVHLPLPAPGPYPPARRVPAPDAAGRAACFEKALHAPPPR